MTGEIESLVLEHLRAIRAKQDQHSERLDRIDLRLSVIEQTVGSLFAMAGEAASLWLSIEPEKRAGPDCSHQRFGATP